MTAMIVYPACHRPRRLLFVVFFFFLSFFLSFFLFFIFIFIFYLFLAKICFRLAWVLVVDDGDVDGPFSGNNFVLNITLIGKIKA